MISLVTYKNLHKYGVAFSSQFKLRHKSFKERQNYNVKSYEGMEYDQYDTPATSYLIYQSPLSGEALGLSRLTPISQCCMIRDLWPDLVFDQSVFSNPKIWESTRFCIEREASPEMRRKISHELVLSHIEYGLHIGISHIIGVMPTIILNSVFKKAGCGFIKLGPEKSLDGMRIQAASMEVSADQLKNVRKMTGFNSDILNLEKEDRLYA